MLMRDGGALVGASVEHHQQLEGVKRLRSNRLQGRIERFLRVEDRKQHTDAQVAGWLVHERKPGLNSTDNQSSIDGRLVNDSDTMHVHVSSALRRGA